MSQPSGHIPNRHLAEFNIGVLKYDWDDPRVKDFAEGLDAVYEIAARSPGFVWRMSDEDMEAAQTDAAGVLGGDPRTASTLSVWESVETLEQFVWATVHRKFYERKGEWYDPTDAVRLVMWWVPEGHRPSIEEAKARYDLLVANGPSDDAFGWDWLPEARLWRDKTCEAAAA